MEVASSLSSLTPIMWPLHNLLFNRRWETPGLGIVPANSMWGQDLLQKKSASKEGEMNKGPKRHHSKDQGEGFTSFHFTLGLGPPKIVEWAGEHFREELPEGSPASLRH